MDGLILHQAVSHHVLVLGFPRKERGGEGEMITAAEPMVVHFAGVAFDVVVFGAAFDDFETCAWDDDVGGVGAAGPFLAVGAVAEGRHHGFARVFVLDGGAHTGAFSHVEGIDRGVR